MSARSYTRIKAKENLRKHRRLQAHIARKQAQGKRTQKLVSF